MKFISLKRKVRYFPRQNLILCQIFILVKKVLVLGTILLALSAVAYFYFEADKRKSASKDLYLAIPNQFPIALECEDWSEVFEKVDTFPYFSTLSKQDWIIGTQVHLDELKNINIFLQGAELPMLHTNTLIAFGNAGNSQLGIFTSSKMKSYLSTDELLAVFDQTNIDYSINLFEQQQIVTIEKDPTGTLHRASFAIQDQVFLYSHQASLVEDGLIALTSEEDPWSSIVQEISGKDDLKLYLKPAQMNYLSSYLLQANSADLMNILEGISAKSIFQLDLLDESIHFNGYTEKGKGTLIDTLKNFTPAALECIQHLPANTAIYQAIGIANNQDQFNDDFELKQFHSIIDEAMVLFTLESYDEELSNRQGGIIALEDVDYLQVLSSLDSSFVPYQKEGDVQVYSSQLGPLLNKAFYQNDYFDDEVYLIAYKNELIVSSNYAVCEQYLFSHADDKTLRSNKSYTDFNASSSSNANLAYYVNLELLQAYLSNASSTNTWQTLYNQMFIQYSNVASLTYCNGKIGFHTEEQASSKTLWTIGLDSSVSMQAQAVVNHNSGKNELLIQDDAKNLYLISASGEILWNVGLKGTIQSKVHQIDYYKNKKLQYLFNTEDKIYIVDRNGELVDGFPIKLPSEASNEILLVNYEQSGNYRYMIACDNGNVYAYEKNGSPLAGWNPKADVGMVTSPIQHDVHEGKDYIFFNNDKGKFFALNRKGENRFSPVQTSVKANSFSLQNGQFVGGDFGSVNSIKLNGELTSKALLDSSYRICQPVKSILQGELAFAFASGSKFKLQQSQWQNFGSYAAGEKIQSIESLVYKNKLWFILSTSNKTYLINEIGDLHPEFPIDNNNISFLDLIPGKDKIMVYSDRQGNLKAIEIGWTNL